MGRQLQEVLVRGWRDISSGVGMMRNGGSNALLLEVGGSRLLKSASALRTASRKS